MARVFVNFLILFLNGFLLYFFFGSGSLGRVRVFVLLGVVFF